MSFQRKLLVVALASVLPMMSAHAQSSADLKKEIEALKAQLQVLTQKVEAMGAQTDNAALVQQVNRIEQKQDLAADDQEKSGFKGVKINGTIEAAFKFDDVAQSHNFSASSGYTDSDAGVGMIQITKESQDGEGVDWTLRLLPGSTLYPVHEASISIPLNKENRIIGGLIPDFQGYEYAFPNANPTLGNQLISHNALYDLAGASAYAGIGMSHTFSNGTYALKWLVGNIDASTWDPYTDSTGAAVVATNAAAASNNVKSVGLAFRGDWYIDEYSYIGFSGLMASVNRNFAIFAVDGGYTHGDWQFNGQLSTGTQNKAAANGDDAAWTGISGLVSYKVLPRLQLLARADFIENRKNGGGTYVVPGSSGSGTDVTVSPVVGGGYGLGPELDPSGNIVDLNVGANLTRVTFGTNYQINANTQWKTEYRIDQSTGYNFLNYDGVTSNYKNAKTGIATSLVLSF